MSDPPATDARKKNSRRWAIAFAVFVLFLVLYAGYRITLRRMVEAELQAIGDGGYPTTPVELDAWYPRITGGQNAATVNVEASSQVTDEIDDEHYNDLPIVGNGGLPPAGQPLPPPMKEAIAAYLHANQKALQLFDSAAVTTPSRYPIDYAEDVYTSFEALVGLYDALGLLELAVIYHADSGDAEKTAQAVVSALGPGGSLRSEPDVMVQIMATAMHEAAVASLERALHWVRFDETQLEKLARALRKAENPDGMRRALIGHRAMYNDAFRDFFFSEGFDPGIFSEARWIFYDTTGLFEADRLKYMHLIQQYIMALELPLDRRHLACADLRLETEKLHKRSFFYALTSLFASEIDVAAMTELQCVAMLRAARTAVAVERYRLVHNALPETLEDLTTEWLDGVPVDPLDGKAIRYRQVKKGYATYSVGEDGRDSGGVLTSRNVEGQLIEADDDLPFRVERP